MCMTLSKSKLSDTILLAHGLKGGGKTINVIGYQNRAKSTGPNAMILPFPAASPMTSDNCIDMSGVRPDLFKKYAELITPLPRGGMKTLSHDFLSFSPVQVFESGSYTVVLASDPSRIPEALERVPLEKRPAPNQKLFSALEKWYRTGDTQWQIALCCWKGSITPEPLLWWYEPLPEFEDNHFLPGLDEHDGGEPNLKYPVDVDHTLIVGSEYGDSTSHYHKEISPNILKYLPSKIIGSVIPKGVQMVNGDWVIPKSGVKSLYGLERVQPPGAV